MRIRAGLVADPVADPVAGPVAGPVAAGNSKRRWYTNPLRYCSVSRAVFMFVIQTSNFQILVGDAVMAQSNEDATVDGVKSKYQRLAG